MTEKGKMLAGKIYDSSDKELAELRTKAHKLSQQYSSLYEDDERRKAILDELLPDHGEGFFLQGLYRTAATYKFRWCPCPFREKCLCKLQSDSA